MKRVVFAGLVVLTGMALNACGSGGGQSMDCSRYVACVAKLAGSSASLDSMYGREGTCWLDTRTAETCDGRCKMSLAAIGDGGC